MRKFINYAVLCVFTAAVLTLASLSYLVSNIFKYEHTLLNIPTIAELDEPKNVSEEVPLSLKRAALSSRSSSVRVVSFSYESGAISVASGTYIVHNNHYFIMTAAHAVIDDKSPLMAVTEDGQFGSLGLVYKSDVTDFAFFEVDEIPNREAVDVVNKVPTAKKWAKRLQTLDSVVYTGYPNGTGPFTIQGKIMGFAEVAVFINTYGWSGASGASVFTEQGEIMGIVSALEVGDFNGLPTPLENSVIVRPTYLVDWSLVFKDYQ